MREIKFRAWEHDRKKICYGYEYYIGDAEQNNYPLMQYTGIKDKNGKEIFEGDILRIEKTASLYYKCPIEIIGVVMFYSGKYEVETKKIINKNYLNKSSIHFGIEPMDWIHLPEFKKAEIIGNVFENPEILKP